MRWFVDILAILVGGLVLVGFSWSNSSGEASALHVERLVIVDSGGRQRAVFGVGDDGAVRLNLLDEEGQSRIALVAERERSEIALTPVREFGWDLIVEEDVHGARVRIGREKAGEGISLGVEMDSATSPSLQIRDGQCGVSAGFGPHSSGPGFSVRCDGGPSVRTAGLGIAGESGPVLYLSDLARGGAMLSTGAAFQAGSWHQTRRADHPGLSLVDVNGKPIGRIPEE